MLTKFLGSLLVATSTNALDLNTFAEVEMGGMLNSGTDASQRYVRNARSSEGNRASSLWGAGGDDIFEIDDDSNPGQDSASGYAKDPWIMYDHKELPSGPDIDNGSVRIQDYGSVNNIKGITLDMGCNAFTMMGGDAYIKDLRRGANLKDMKRCSGCQSWVYVP